MKKVTGKIIYVVDVEGDNTFVRKIVLCSDDLMSNVLANELKVEYGCTYIVRLQNDISSTK